MFRFVMKRLAQFLVVLIITSVIIFVMVRLSNTDPVSVIMGGKQTTPEAVANLRAKFGLDQPLFKQYINWVAGMLHGDFGVGFKYQQPVVGMIVTRLPVTLGLVCFGSAIALIAAIPLGIVCALRRNTLLDRALSVLSLILVSCPTFLTSIIMVAVVVKAAPSYPIMGGYSGLEEYLVRLLLPSVALAFSMIALTSRITRTSMINQLQAGYTETGVAKGMSSANIVWKHALKNAVIPVIAVASIQIGSMIVGSVLVENVFSLSGLGSLLVSSVKASDYPVVQGITMLLVFIFLIISTVVDVIYAAIDPRIRD